VPRRRGGAAGVAASSLTSVPHWALCTLSADARRGFRPETMVLIDATTNEEVGPPLLMAS
jgi:hypothetical protein